jgi:hypothetical protein
MHNGFKKSNKNAGKIPNNKIKINKKFNNFHSLGLISL